MRFFLLFFSLVILISCSSVKPVEDQSPAPAPIKVYTLETVACGNRFMGTGGCLISPSEDISKKSIKIIIPHTTNQKNRSSLLQIKSLDCRVEVVRQVISGQEITFTLSNLLSETRLSKNCNLDITVVPSWQNQEQFTFPVGSFIGRVLLMLSEHPATVITTNPSSPLTMRGFARLTARPGVANTTRNIRIDTGGSKAGRIVMQGCGFQTFDYRSANPTVNVPVVSSSCVFGGTVLRLDVKGDLAFFGAIDTLPRQYLLLSNPLLKETNGKPTLYLDPAVSAFNINGELFFGTMLELKREHLQGNHFLRQVTTNGRQSLSYFSNGVLKWTIQ